MINGTLYESVQFSSDDSLYKYTGLYIDDNLTENDEIVIEIHQLVNRKRVQVTFSDDYSNDISDIYISDEDGHSGCWIDHVDYIGECDFRRYNILHFTGNVTNPGHSVKISVEPEIAYDTHDLEPYGTGEIDVEVLLKDLVYPGENDEYYNNIDYVNIHFKMNWE